MFLWRKGTAAPRHYLEIVHRKGTKWIFLFCMGSISTPAVKDCVPITISYTAYMKVETNKKSNGSQVAN